MRMTLTASVLATAAGLALASADALADAALFDTASPILRAVDFATRERIASEPGVKKVTPLYLNRNALNSSVVTISLDGKTYRFVGARTPPQEALPGVSGWYGKGPGPGDELTVIAASDGGAVGNASVGRRHFTINSREGATIVFLVEREVEGIKDIEIPAEPSKRASAPRRAPSSRR